MSEEKNVTNTIFKGLGSALGSFAKGVQSATAVAVDSFKVQPSEVLSKLQEFEIKKSHYSKDESHIEKLILEYLNDNFKHQAHSQYSIGGYLALKIDIDIADGRVGIELKLAKELIATDTKNAGNIQRLFGQAIYYSKRKYDKGNLIICIVGTEQEEKSQIINEIKKFIEELNLKFIFIKLK